MGDAGRLRTSKIAKLYHFWSSTNSSHHHTQPSPQPSSLSAGSVRNSTRKSKEKGKPEDKTPHFNRCDNPLGGLQSGRVAKWHQAHPPNPCNTSADPCLASVLRPRLSRARPRPRVLCPKAWCSTSCQSLSCTSAQRPRKQDSTDPGLAWLTVLLLDESPHSSPISVLPSPILKQPDTSKGAPSYT